MLRNESVQALNGDRVTVDRTFAGTGLFGDYALFFPAQTLSSGSNAGGLHLHRIEDILRRIEYISAAAPLP